MKIFYRIVSLDEKEGLMTVRYWTDFLSEVDLRQDPDDTSIPPKRCRTEYTLNLWQHNMSEDELHRQIINFAPKNWFRLKHRAINGEIASNEVVKKLIGKKFSSIAVFHDTKEVPEEIDITDKLK